jgi:hypothetical protein
MTPPPTVTVPVSDLEYVRDLLMERVHGSPARSPGHNARLTIESMLSAAPQPAAPSSLAGGEGREKVARIVDPETFALIAHYTGIERFDRLSPAERESPTPTPSSPPYPRKPQRGRSHTKTCSTLTCLSARLRTRRARAGA